MVNLQCSLLIEVKRVRGERMGVKGCMFHWMSVCHFTDVIVKDYGTQQCFPNQFVSNNT